MSVQDELKFGLESCSIGLTEIRERLALMDIGLNSIKDAIEGSAFDSMRWYHYHAAALTGLLAAAKTPEVDAPLVAHKAMLIADAMLLAEADSHCCPEDNGVEKWPPGPETRADGKA